ncbi:MAG: hypothetical protein ACREXP_21385 [Steroidobacteraceae bacterium]
MSCSPAWRSRPFADEESYADFIANQESSEYIEVVHRGQGVQIQRNHFSRTCRLELLSKLQAACRRVGVTLDHSVRIEPESIDADWDRVVCADGINSGLRTRFAAEFGTQIASRRNRFAWYGTRRCSIRSR